MADSTSPRPGDTLEALLRKILTVLGGVANPSDSAEVTTAKILAALKAALG